MNMMAKAPARQRGVMAVCAEAADQSTLIERVAKGFEAFKANDVEEKKGIAKKFDDVLTREAGDRINAEITALTKEIEKTKALASALQVGPAPNGEDPDVKAHAEQFSNWFRKGDQAMNADMRDLEVNAKLTTQSDSDGGYLVPSQMETEIDRVLGSVSAMRNLAQVMQISAPTYKKLVNVGGSSSGWVGEGEARSETATPKLKEIVFNLQELYANPYSTQRNLDDSTVDVAAWLAEEVSVEFAEQEGASFITGDGVKKPKGILAYPTVANASYAWGKVGVINTGAAAKFAASDPADAFYDLYHALKSGYRNGAAWMMNDVVLGTARKFKDANGNYLWTPPTGNVAATFMGKPIITDDSMPNLSAGSLSVAFGNFQRGYLVVDGVGIRVLRDPFTSKPNVSFYTTKRVGGGIQNFEAIKLMKTAA